MLLRLAGNGPGYPQIITDDAPNLDLLRLPFDFRSPQSKVAADFVNVLLVTTLEPSAYAIRRALSQIELITRGIPAEN